MHGFGLFRILIEALMTKLGCGEMLSVRERGSHNTSIVHHQRHTYALVETYFPLGIRAQVDKGLDVQTK